MKTLRKTEIAYLLTWIPVSTRLHELVTQGVGRGLLQLSDEDADSLRDLCTDRLDQHGFDADYAFTAEGQLLSELIDKLYIG